MRIKSCPVQFSLSLSLYYTASFAFQKIEEKGREWETKREWVEEKEKMGKRKGERKRERKGKRVRREKITRIRGQQLSFLLDHKKMNKKYQDYN